MYLPTVPIIFPLPHYPVPQSLDNESIRRSEYWVKARDHMSAFGGRREVDKQGVSHRQHAAVDLYAPAGTIIMAIADGVIIDDIRGGYLGWPDATPGNRNHSVDLAALAIAHPGVGIIRYCEISPRRAIGVGWRMPVRRGQIIGFVGDQGAERHGANIVRRQTMLHLEWYWDLADSKVDPNDHHDGASKVGGHVLSQGNRNEKNLTTGETVFASANKTYDCFGGNADFQRRHDVLDPTDLMRSAQLTTLPPALQLNPKLSVPPSFSQLLRHASRMSSLQQPNCMGENNEWWRK